MSRTGNDRSRKEQPKTANHLLFKAIKSCFVKKAAMRMFALKGLMT